MDKLDVKAIAFIALANEYCKSLESAYDADKNEFIDCIIKILPRLYISAIDLPSNPDGQTFIEPYLDEDYYENIRHHIEMLLGPDDVYLEVFEQDMKYSDTPIGVSVAESLADIYQDLYNFISNVKDAPNEIINEMVSACKDDFESYWGQKLCNVLRAIHNLKYNNEH